MKTIYKYALYGREESLLMPVGAKILSVQFQGDTLCLWASVNPMLITEERFITIFGTGDPISEESIEFLGTVQNGRFVWHVFEKLS